MRAAVRPAVVSACPELHRSRYSMTFMDGSPLGRVVRQVETTLRRIPVLAASPVVVACSGGKDSLVLAVVLQELGLNPTAALVDLGYDNTWADRVTSRLEMLGIGSQVLAPAQPKLSAGTFLGTLGQLQRNLTVLSFDLEPSVTPCTACYNSKVLLIQHELGSMSPAPVVAFGHHASDAAASLLKSVFMYMDRWDLGHETYERDIFRTACNEFGDQLMAGNRTLIDRIQEIIRSGLASTDEPLVQQLIVGDDQSLLMVRPLIDVWEHEIVDAVGELDVAPESSGCGHTAALDTQTPREIVLFEVVRRMEGIPELRSLLTEWINLGLDDNGRLTVDARRRRTEILGPTYKAAPGGVQKL